MSSDDQHFLDILSSIPNQILQYSSEITNTLEKHFDSAALSLRDRLTHAAWLPESIRPSPPPPPPSSLFVPYNAYADTFSITGIYYIDALFTWIHRHRAITAATVAFFSTGGYLYYSQRRAYLRKRRAVRGRGGMRKEVVVVKGTVNSPITRSVVLDLERRGFVVYVVVGGSEEVEMVRKEGKADVLPLRVDVCDPLDVKDIISHFNSLLTTPSSTWDSNSNVPPPDLHFAGLLLIPDFSYPSGPLETLSPELWSDALNAKLLSTIATAQAFLRTVIDLQSRIVVLTPSITSSLALPFNGVETACVKALEGWVDVLRSELSTVGGSVVQIKVGNLDLAHLPGSASAASGSAAASRQRQQQQQQQRHQGQLQIESGETAEWSDAARDAYARNYSMLQGKSMTMGSKVRGSPIRELHNAVFDALTLPQSSGVWRVGRGSLVYEVLGKWMPQRLVHLMLGIRRTSLGALDQVYHEPRRDYQG